MRTLLYTYAKTKPDILDTPPENPDDMADMEAWVPGSIWVGFSNFILELGDFDGTTWGEVYTSVMDFKRVEYLNPNEKPWSIWPQTVPLNYDTIVIVNPGQSILTRPLLQILENSANDPNAITSRILVVKESFLLEWAKSDGQITFTDDALEEVASFQILNPKNWQATGVILTKPIPEWLAIVAKINQG